MSTPITCTPSELISYSPCVKCASENQKLAGLVYALAEESDYSLPGDTHSLLSDSACFNCMTDSQMLDALVNLFANRYLIGQETISELIQNALCLSCATERQIKGALLYLICQNFMKPYILESDVVQLVGGSATVASSFADPANPIVLGYYSQNGTASTLGYQNIVAGVSFQIFSGTILDTNYVSWAILKS